VLVVQSLPFAATVGLAALDGSRINDFAFWRGVEARLMALLPQRGAVAKAPVAADERIETTP
jgi:hypothetical protein